MADVIRLIYSLLVFLFPVALYCLALSYLNRSRQPVLVPGAWDAAGLLFALSGFLLWTVPGLIDVVLGRFIDYLPGARNPTTLRQWVVLIRFGYFLAVAVGAALLLVLRRRQTAIYNVETHLFRARFQAALAELGLAATERAGRLVLAPAVPVHVEGSDAISTGPAPAKPPAGEPCAELTVDPFPPMCHVTLHWGRVAPGVRREVEGLLAQTLEGAAAADNPAAGWFLGFSGLTFLLITVLAVFFVILIVWRGH